MAVAMRKQLLLIAFFVLALDRLTKSLVISHIPLYGAIDIIPGIFRLTHLENTGAAFSMFADDPGPWPGRFLTWFSLAALVAISIVLWKTRNARTSIALAFISGGTLGNLWDRLLRGKVTDFLDFYLGPHHWPPFNFADSAIVVGAVLLAVAVLPGKRDTAERLKG
jgi:signal peptidase II